MWSPTNGIMPGYSSLALNIEWYLLWSNYPESVAIQLPNGTSPLFCIFLRQLRDNLWVTSSLNSLYCLKMPRPEYSTDVQQTWNMNEQIILPPVALVNVTPGYTMACPGFTLVGRPIVSNTSSLITVYNSSLLPSNISVVDVFQYLTKNTTWFKTGSNQKRIEAIMTRIRQPIIVSTIQTHQALHMWSFGVLMISWIAFGLIVISLYCVIRRKRRNSLQKLWNVSCYQPSIENDTVGKHPFQR